VVGRLAFHRIVRLGFWQEIRSLVHEIEDGSDAKHKQNTNANAEKEGFQVSLLFSMAG
jgi:hypothetical protein